MDITVHFVKDKQKIKTKSLSFQHGIKVCDLWKTIYNELHLGLEEDEYMLYIQDDDHVRTNDEVVGEIEFHQGSKTATAAADEEYGLETGMELVVEQTEDSDEGVLSWLTGKTKSKKVHVANTTDETVTVEIHTLERIPKKIPSKKLNIGANANATGGGLTYGSETGEVDLEHNIKIETQDIFAHGSDWLIIEDLDVVNVVFPNILTTNGTATNKKVEVNHGVIISESGNKLLVFKSATKGKKKPIQHWRKYGSKANLHPHQSKPANSTCPTCKEPVEEWQRE